MKIQEILEFLDGMELAYTFQGDPLAQVRAIFLPVPLLSRLVHLGQSVEKMCRSTLISPR